MSHLRMPQRKMLRSKKSHRASLLIGLLGLAFVTTGSGTCVVVEEDPYGGYEEPGVNEEKMEEQEIEIMENR